MELAILLLVVAVLVALLAAAGRTRIALPRKPGFEGIEDPDTAAAYDRISRWPQFRLLRGMVARKLAGHAPAGMLADIGCGPGRLAVLIAQRHPHLRVIGIDTAAEMVRAAASLASTLDLAGRVEFHQGDVSRLPVPDGALDWAVSTLSLHHWSDPQAGLAEIHRALQGGGQLLLFDLRRDARRFFYWLMRFAQTAVVPAALRRANEPLGSLLASYTLPELQELLAGSPFAEWRVEGGAVWTFAWARKGGT